MIFWYFDISSLMSCSLKRFWGSKVTLFFIEVKSQTPIVKPTVTVYEGTTVEGASFLLKLQEEGLQSH